MQHLNTTDQLYIDSLRDTLENGVVKHDRTGVGTTSVFGRMQTFDLYGYKMPIPSFRKNFPRSWIHETLWFISGSTDIKYLKDNNVSIWDSWVNPETATFRDMTIDEMQEKLRMHFTKKYGGDITFTILDADSNAAKEYAITFNPNNQAGVDVAIHRNHLDEVYKTSIGEEPKVLLSGSIGQGAYGYQWRQLEDTRLIDKGVDLTPYLERGFSHEGDLAETQVITRKVDQLQGMIDLLRTNPDSRRIIMVAYNPTMTDKQDAVLPPCFPKGSMVSTPQGYRPIEEIEVGDIVYSASMKPRRVNHVWTTPYGGDMVGLKMAYIPTLLISTPNHPHFVVGKGWVPANKIEEGDLLRIPIRDASIERKPHKFVYEQICNQGRSVVEYEHVLTKNDYFVLGYFVGNGWYMPNSSHRVCFAVPTHKVDYILPRIREMVKVSLKSNSLTDSVGTYETRSKKWGSLLPDFGYRAPSKQIPEWMFNSPLDCIEEFLNGYFEADGNVGPGPGTRTFVTTSRKLAYGLQRLWGMFDRAAGISYQKRKETTVIEGRYVNQRDTYIIRVASIKPMLSTRYSNDSMDVVVRTKFDLAQKDEQVVYNLDVEDEHTYIVNNTATHNCHSWVQCWTRELDWSERLDWAMESGPLERESSIEITAEELDDLGVPRRALQLLLMLRSNDEPAGRQSNIPQYAMLAHMLAQCAGMVAEKLIIMNGDLHIYSNQHDAVNEMLERDSHPDSNPTIRLNPDIREIDDFTFDDIEIVDYHHQPHIHVPIAV